MTPSGSTVLLTTQDVLAKIGPASLDCGGGGPGDGCRRPGCAKDPGCPDCGWEPAQAGYGCKRCHLVPDSCMDARTISFDAYDEGWCVDAVRNFVDRYWRHEVWLEPKEFGQEARPCKFWHHQYPQADRAEAFEVVKLCAIEEQFALLRIGAFTACPEAQRDLDLWRQRAGGWRVFLRLLQRIERELRATGLTLDNYYTARGSVVGGSFDADDSSDFAALAQTRRLG